MAKIFLQINYIWRHLIDILTVCWKLASGLWRKEGSFPKEPRWLERWSGGVIYDTSCNQEVSSLSLSLSLSLSTDLRHCSASLHKLQCCADVLLSYSTQGTPVVFCKMQSTRRTKRHMPSLDSLQHHFHHQKQHHQQHQHQHHQPAFVQFSRKSSNVMQM